MNYSCPKISCKSNKVANDGFYLRPSDGQKIQRLRCLLCSKRFSHATFQAPFGQNKRRVNHPLYKLLCSGVSMRRGAILLNVHRITVARKLEFLAEECKKVNKGEVMCNLVKHIQFDDLITREHSKCKPLSITVAVEAPGRRILGFEVSRIPASGHLAAIAKKKYGPRPNQRPAAVKKLLLNLKDIVNESTQFSSDEDILYRRVLNTVFPRCEHHRYKGLKSANTGQGELKKVGFDPLFTINHTLAMLRANINRLFRRTWCTTKKPIRLEQHLHLYMNFHNQVLLVK